MWKSQKRVNRVNLGAQGKKAYNQTEGQILNNKLLWAIVLKPKLGGAQLLDQGNSRLNWFRIRP